jgi:excisionase family DNA binding protein
MSALVVLTPEEVAERMKLAPKTVLLLCRRGELPGARKAGRRWRIPEHALAAYFSAESVGHASGHLASAPDGTEGRSGPRGRRPTEAATDGVAGGSDLARLLARQPRTRRATTK